jgi:hypothetical protein
VIDLKALRYAARSCRRIPGILGLVAFTLALGIGGTTAVFSVVDGLLRAGIESEARHR